MAGQIETVTLITTAESGVPADWASAGGAARGPASNAARASLKIVFRIASLHHEGRDGVRLFNIHAMRSAHPLEGATNGRADIFDGRGGAWNASKSSSLAVDRLAWRSP